MRLYEHEAKKLFGAAGLKIPRPFGTAESAAAASRLAPRYPAMVKALVLTGGRGKAGGVRRVENRTQARAAARDILRLTLGGEPVGSVLVEETVEAAGAAYLGVTLHPVTFAPTILASPLGGVDIEAASASDPDAVLRIERPENPPELEPAAARRVGRFLADGLRLPGAANAIADAAARLFAFFQAADAKTAEVNPLLVTADGTPIAADAKVVLDDNALYRQWRVFEALGLTEPRHDASELTRDERRARDAGFPYLDLLPEGAPKRRGRIHVGLVPGGAGYGIFSIDETANIGERHFDGRVVPVNFMDSGGGPSEEKVAGMFHLLMDKPIVDLIVTSRFGGISSCDVFIRGLIRCLRERHADGRRMPPVYGRMVGTELPRARATLEAARAGTPEPLAGLEIEVGNRKIMAEVIRDALERHLAGKGGAR